MSQPTQPLQTARIQIDPVDDGFVIQGQAIDGRAKTARNVATNPDEMRKKVHAIVDQLYVEPPTPAPPTAPTPATPGGPAGTESPS